VPSAADIIRLLELKPHPEGGHYRQTFRDSRTVDGTRAASTAIYFLLARGERSHWHRVDAVEAWHYHAGAPLRLEIAADMNGAVDRVTLGPDLTGGERPQAIVPAHVWQAAQSLGDWTLVARWRRASSSRGSSSRRRAGRRLARRLNDPCADHRAGALTRGTGRRLRSVSNR